MQRSTRNFEIRMSSQSKKTEEIQKNTHISLSTCHQLIHFLFWFSQKDVPAPISLCLYFHLQIPFGSRSDPKDIQDGMFRQLKKCVHAIESIRNAMRGSRNFCQRGSNFDKFFFFFKGRDDPSKFHYKWAINVLLACKIKCWLGRFFRGSGSVLLRNPIFLWFFRGGPDPLFPPPPPPSGSAPAKR